MVLCKHYAFLSHCLSNVINIFLSFLHFQLFVSLRFFMVKIKLLKLQSRPGEYSVASVCFSNVIDSKTLKSANDKCHYLRINLFFTFDLTNSFYLISETECIKYNF